MKIIDKNKKMIQDFIEMSRIAGMRRDLVQAGGGNTSFKLNDEKMVIKSSGVQLSELRVNYGLSYVNHKMIVDAFEKGDDLDEKTLLNECLIEGNRPSIETFLHAITQTFTLHSHSLLINVITSRENGLNEIQSLFPSALIIGYKTPGLPLSKDIYEGFKQYRKHFRKEPNIIILKNHGLIASADSAQECLDITQNVTNNIEEYLELEKNKENYSEMLYYFFKEKENNDYPDIVYWVNNTVVKDAYLNNSKKIWDFQFCPDAIVYCGKKVFEYGVDDYMFFVQNYAKPIIILYKDEFYIRASNVRKAKDIESLLEFTAQVSLLNTNYKMDLLSDQEQNFLLNWDSEKYRQKM